MPGHHSQSRLEGEHPYGDLGQLILLILFVKKIILVSLKNQ